MRISKLVLECFHRVEFVLIWIHRSYVVCNELLAGDIKERDVPTVIFYMVGNSLDKMGFTQTHPAIDKERVCGGMTHLVSDRVSSGKSKSVVRALNKSVEDIAWFQEV